MNSKLYNVVGRILSKTLNEKDPVFSQNKHLTKTLRTNPKKNKHNIEHLRDRIHIKPVISSSKEKELKASATKGVVKFLNMIVQHQGNTVDKNKTNLGSKETFKITKPNRQVKAEPIRKINRFDEVVRSASKSK